MKYRVRFYKEERSSVRYEIEVEADSPLAAREKVRGAHEDDYNLLTDEEWETEESGKEELLGGEFSGLAELDDPYAVVEVEPDPLPKWDVFAARDGDTFRETFEAEDEDAARLLARPRINQEFRMGLTAEKINADPDFFDGELDGFRVDEA